MLVVDASVVVKMFIPERGGEAAPLLLERPETLLVPAHCFAEVGEVLSRKHRSGMIIAAQIGTTLRALPKTFQVVPLAEILGEAVRLSIERRVSVYDSLYVALAMREGCTLITADNRLIAGFAKSSWERLIQPL